MGDPSRAKKTYSRPLRPWDSVRISQEKKILENYGLRRKKEIWKAESILRNFRGQARALQAKPNEERVNELLTKLKRLNLAGESATLDNVLSLSLNDILDRRLQSLVFAKGLANTPKQARQMIVHGHVLVGDRKMRWPSFLVPKELEDKIEARIKVNEE